MGAAMAEAEEAAKAKEAPPPYTPSSQAGGLGGDEGDGKKRMTSLELASSRVVCPPLLQIQIQIQIQIGSLHTRLDETSEMTNAASLYSRTFS